MATIGSQVLARGRPGQVVLHDRDDPTLTFKVSFGDGGADWFKQDDVCLNAATATHIKAEGSAEKLAELEQNQADWAGRVAGTPVNDEGFICMGGPAPHCPTGPQVLNGTGNKKDWNGRVLGTPIKDEGFICMGGPAPICTQGVGQVARGVPIAEEKFTPDKGPITLDVLQGAWTNSSGASITVFGTAVNINGMPLNGQGVEMDDGGNVVSIGRIWQLDRWTKEGGIEFRCSSTREGMESAKSEVWSRSDGSHDAWAHKMKELGYGGSAADPLGRGVDGCMPGTMGIEEGEGPVGYAESRDKRDVGLLQALIGQWREPSTEQVQSRNVIPDFTNRSQTGLGVELVHFIAISIGDKGFQKRIGSQGHDIPVLVREIVGSPFRDEALRVWKERVAEEEGFPPVRVDTSKDFFVSLGNGHFNQALNLYDCECKGINEDRVYRTGSDVLLQEAITEGVTSIVLKYQTPRPVRAKIAELLNSKREFHWTLSEDGQVDVNADCEQDYSYCSQFEWLSKGMDAEQVNCLVRTHCRIKESKRIMG